MAVCKVGVLRRDTSLVVTPTADARRQKGNYREVASALGCLKSSLQLPLKPFLTRSKPLSTSLHPMAAVDRRVISILALALPSFEQVIEYSTDRKSVV